MGNPALSGIRICDLAGQVAGAGATKTLAAFGAEVIRVEDPVRQGGWDTLRGKEPFVDDRRGTELGGGFNNYNVGKRGITLNLRTERGRELLSDIIRVSDVVTENFSGGTMEGLGFSYERLQSIKPDIVYVSSCGFGHTGPYRRFRTWGPIVQAVCGLTSTSGARGQPLAGWGFSLMDHHSANFMALAVLMALYHRDTTGEGQWVDISQVEAGVAMVGPAILDWSVNGRPFRSLGLPDSNHSQHPVMVPHNIYPSAGLDEWIAIACRHDEDWTALSSLIGRDWAADEKWGSVEGRRDGELEMDELIGSWTKDQPKFDTARRLQAVGVPAAAVQRPQERIDLDASTGEFGLWPVVTHPAIGQVRVDGIPVHLSDDDWKVTRGAPLLGQDNAYVYGELLGLSAAEIGDLRANQVI